MKDYDVKFAIVWELFIFQNLPNLRKIALYAYALVWALEIVQILNSHKILKNWTTWPQFPTNLSQVISSKLDVRILVLGPVIYAKKDSFYFILKIFSGRLACQQAMMNSDDKRLLEASASGQTDQVLQLIEEHGHQLHKFKDQVSLGWDVRTHTS